MLNHIHYLLITGRLQPHPLKQHFNHGVHQPFGVPQQFYNHPTNNDRSWIDKAVAYRAFPQNQQAQQPNNQQRVPRIKARFGECPKFRVKSFS